jgi:hypothetical protein
MEIEKTYPELLEMGKNARTALAEMLKLSHEQVASQKAQITELNVVVSYLDAKITSASNCHERAIPFLLSEALERTHLDFHRDTLKYVNYNLVPIVSDIAQPPGIIVELDLLEKGFDLPTLKIQLSHDITLATHIDDNDVKYRYIGENSYEVWMDKAVKPHWREMPYNAIESASNIRAVSDIDMIAELQSEFEKLQNAYQTLAQEDDKKSDRIKELEEKSIEAWLTEEGEKNYPESVDSKWERFAYENAKRSASEFYKRKGNDE